MCAHLGAQASVVAKKDKKLCYELELFEQNLEDLLATESGVCTTVSASVEPKTESVKSEDVVKDELGADGGDSSLHEEVGGDLCLDELPENVLNSDLAEWNVVFSEPNVITNLAQCGGVGSGTLVLPGSVDSLSPQMGGNRKKRFKTNSSTAIALGDLNSGLAAMQQTNEIGNSAAS